MSASKRVSILIEREVFDAIVAEADRRDRPRHDIVGDAFEVYRQIPDVQKARYLGVPEEYFLNVIEGRAERAARPAGDSRAG